MLNTSSPEDGQRKTLGREFLPFLLSYYFILEKYYTYIHTYTYIDIFIHTHIYIYIYIYIYINGIKKKNAQSYPNYLKYTHIVP